MPVNQSMTNALAALKVVRGNSQLNVDWISSLEAGPSLILPSKGQNDNFCRGINGTHFRIKRFGALVLSITKVSLIEHKKK